MVEIADVEGVLLKAQMKHDQGWHVFDPTQTRVPKETSLAEVERKRRRNQKKRLARERKRQRMSEPSATNNEGCTVTSGDADSTTRCSVLVARDNCCSKTVDTTEQSTDES